MEINKQTRMRRTYYFKSVIIVFICGLVFAMTVFADKAAPHRPVSIYSANKRFVLLMTPEYGSNNYNYGGYGKGKGVLYSLENGSRKEIWNVPFYASTNYLSNDGNFLISFGPWANSLENLAVSFHLKGKLLKSYRVKDLIEDPTKLSYSVSHLEWRSFSSDPSFTSSEQVFRIPLIDGHICDFEVKTGTKISCNK